MMWQDLFTKQVEKPKFTYSVTYQIVNFASILFIAVSLLLWIVNTNQSHLYDILVIIALAVSIIIAIARIIKSLQEKCNSYAAINVMLVIVQGIFIYLFSRFLE